MKNPDDYDPRFENDEGAFEPELPVVDEDWLARYPDYDPLENYPADEEAPAFDPTDSTGWEDPRVDR